MKDKSNINYMNPINEKPKERIKRNPKMMYYDEFIKEYEWSLDEEEIHISEMCSDFVKFKCRRSNAEVKTFRLQPNYINMYWFYQQLLCIFLVSL